jgi:ubiquinone/menaquinone biosynthesis C-methylase UbiE
VSSEAARFFGERVEWYDSGYDRLSSNGHCARARLDAAVELIGPGPGDVLDAGMGPGRLIAALARRGWVVSGVDAAEEMVGAARMRLPEAAERMLVAAIESLPFEDESFDAVTATGVLEYSDVARSLAELHRVLRPGGRAVVSYPNPHAFYAVWKGHVYYRLVRAIKRALRMADPNRPRGAGSIPPERFRQLLSAAGFVPFTTRYSSFLAVPAPLDTALGRTSARLGQALEGRAPNWLATQVLFGAQKPGRD